MDFIAIADELADSNPDRGFRGDANMLMAAMIWYLRIVDKRLDRLEFQMEIIRRLLLRGDVDEAYVDIRPSGVEFKEP